jgi:hypothetical protein
MCIEKGEPLCCFIAANARHGTAGRNASSNRIYPVRAELVYLLEQGECQLLSMLTLQCHLVRSECCMQSPRHTIQANSPLTPMYTCNNVDQLLYRAVPQAVSLDSHRGGPGSIKSCEKNSVFWNVTPCDSCKNRRFGGT